MIVTLKKGSVWRITINDDDGSLFVKADNIYLKVTGKDF